jgi:hypothetical protein
MNINKQGITYLYSGDRLTLLWPWVPVEGRYYSQEFNRYFNNLKEYWKHHGAFYKYDLDHTTKMEGFSWGEVMTHWVRDRYPYDAIVVMTNINVSERSLSFWARLPKDKIECMQRDVVILRGNSRSEIMEIAESIDSKFADTFAFYSGKLIGGNQ